MKAKKFLLIYFKQSRQNNQLKAKKNTAKQSQLAAKENELPRHNKENHGRKTSLANSLGAGYVSYFKAVFCVRVVAVRDLEVVQCSFEPF